jgi:hypothetical protein
MINKIKKFVGKYIKFSTKFVAPIILEEQNRDVIKEKIHSEIKKSVDAKNEKLDKEVNSHNVFIDELIKCHLGQSYNSVAEMQINFEICNKKWLKYCRDVNGRSKIISLNKNAFKDNVQRILKEHELEKQMRNLLKPKVV